jgi:hypothetical protein
MIVARLRDAVVAELKKLLPGAQVEAHGGTFDENEMARFAVRSPALLVCVSDVGNFTAQGRVLLGEVTVGIALVAGPGKKGQSPDAVALAALAPLLSAIAGRRWGLDGVDGRPERLQAKNLYSGKLAAGHAALWGVSFRQTVEMGAGLLSPEELAALDEFLSARLEQRDPADNAALTDDIFNVRTGEPEPE